ncbi:MAG: homoserine kinase [Bifidobacteriaceae bacterium]|jgi:homoserine kinase|nr:homoserine kinase [Bifidobacteriaceae bacterium]
MRFACDHVLVRVPASATNLGPGFDALGLALDLWDEIEVKAVPGPTAVVIHGEGDGELPPDERHLVVRAAHQALELAGAPPIGLQLDCTNRIPQRRGLGSSAAAAVAGGLIARGLIENPAGMNAGRVFELAAGLEGHPDNAAPAVFGGATVAWLEAGLPRAAKLAVHPAVRAVALVPEHPVATALARAALPARVTHQDAAFNAGRAALMVHALASDPSLLMEASQDRLHQPYRAEVMPQTIELMNDLRSRGVPAMISGAGPAVLCLTAEPGRVPAVEGWRRLELGITARGGSVGRYE